MANSNVFFSELKSGRCSSVVEARLLRFSEARNVKRGGELMWADLLSVDVNAGRCCLTVEVWLLRLWEVSGIRCRRGTQMKESRSFSACACVGSTKVCVVSEVKTIRKTL